MLALLLIGVLSLGDSGRLVRKDASAVGMSAERLAAIDRVMTRAIEARGFPGAAVVVGRNGAVVWQRGFGSLDWSLPSTAVDAGTTLYDVASITKVVATATAAMVLYDRGRIGLDDRVSKYLPEYRFGTKARVSIRHLLTHRSGLPAGRALWRARSAAEARRRVLATPLEREPGAREVYSDIGADVLAMVVEKAAREPFERFITRNVFARLGMRNTMFRPPRRLHRLVAPTETHPPRGHPIRGEVHDENAYALGGVAGHAGLFSTAADLAVFAQMLLDGGRYGNVRIVRDSTVALFTRRSPGSPARPGSPGSAARPGWPGWPGWRALGWDSCDGGNSCGHYMSERAYGHNGYAGTSLWIDPDRGLFVILLTNWVHPPANRGVAPSGILADVRDDLADIAAFSIIDGAEGVPLMPARLRADRAIGWRGW